MRRTVLKYIGKAAPTLWPELWANWEKSGGGGGGFVILEPA